MLPTMFVMGGSEILVILIVALIFLGPEKLPDAATKISKGSRELRRQTREVQETIENDTEIGGAIRDLKSALRGDEICPKVRAQLSPLADAAKTIADAVSGKPEAAKPEAATADAKPATEPAADSAARGPAGAESKDAPVVRALPDEAGEHHDPDAPAASAQDDAELAKLIR